MAEIKRRCARAAITIHAHGTERSRSKRSREINRGNRSCRRGPADEGKLAA